MTDTLGALPVSAQEMREIVITLPDGRISVHKRPVGLPDHIAFIDRSMGADEFFGLHKMARENAKGATDALANEQLMDSKMSRSLLESPTLK